MFCILKSLVLTNLECLSRGIRILLWSDHWLVSSALLMWCYRSSFASCLVSWSWRLVSVLADWFQDVTRTVWSSYCSCFCHFECWLLQLRGNSSDSYHYWSSSISCSCRWSWQYLHSCSDIPGLTCHCHEFSYFGAIQIYFILYCQILLN